MLITTAPFIAGWRVQETKGHVFGLVVRSRGIGGNAIGWPPLYRRWRDPRVHEPLEDTRGQAIDSTVQNATMIGANAIISMRFDSSETANTMTEIVAYGTAVVVVPDANAPPWLKADARAIEH